VKRSLGYLLVGVGAMLAVAVGAFDQIAASVRAIEGGSEGIVRTVLAVASICAGAYGLYLLGLGLLERSNVERRRVYHLRNVLRLGIGAGALVAALGVVTEQWVGLLFSLGIVGFAVTFALQQPLFSLLGWLYIVTKEPYRVGDRVKIEDAKGDVIDVDFLVTTLWEINGDLVSSNQPSGRIVTLPNSVVLSSQVYNYSWEEFPWVWNEISVQVAYETDLAFARQVMIDVADEMFGDEMSENVARYREVLADTPVELEVQDRPTVNVVQQESWVELRLRYLVSPRGGQRVKNKLYERILKRFNENPSKVAFPVSRNR